MNVIVVGANGQIGKQVTTLLHEHDDHEVTALVRKEEQQKELESKGIRSTLADLEGSVDELTEAVKGHDAVVFAAGSGGSTGPDKTLLIDLDGAGKTVEAAKNAGVERFIMVSAIQANNRENWGEKIRPYFVAKHYADKEVLQSGLNYTIIRPGSLTNDEGTGKVSAASNLDRGDIPRADVAKTIVASISNAKTFNKSFDLVAGDHSVDDALSNI
ncbi:SDR family oxidoreductase [Paenalkalicoccus suaedae]|uniref:SDR family oxidoreductase n=1 Tax=Paenalkalicoccus suaedae TaxID=2592382 RepID=A0A859F9Z6_9BACI|nr:SDR family oxidoreductase [Paenalkalicoccus suaedae]QKS70043.1 SDR family oxidoreductase [Paenalkalicoccus suaedae]